MRNRRYRRRGALRGIYSFALSWIILSWLFPIFEFWGIVLVFMLCAFIAFLAGKSAGRKEKTEFADAAKAEAARAYSQTSTSARKGVNPQAEKPKEKKSYGPEIDPIIDEGNRALSEMGRLYMTIKDNEVRSKINEIMRITDKIMQDAIEDPSDIPQIKKFFRYYLPTTIKLLNSYDRMSSQGIEGETISKSMNSINEMLDVAIEAYKKRLDSLFENQALDIETDIDVFNQMLASEGLTGTKDFKVQSQKGSI